MAEWENRALWDYVLFQTSAITSSIVSPVVEANNFEVSPALVTFVERDQFGGHLSDNPNVHLRKFLTKYDSIKFNGVSNDATRWRLFSFSLRNRANDRGSSLLISVFDHWEREEMSLMGNYPFTLHAWVCFDGVNNWFANIIMLLIPNWVL